MRKLSIPVLGLVLVCAFAGPIASAATYSSFSQSPQKAYHEAEDNGLKV
jgi:hypothetical protein